MSLVLLDTSALVALAFARDQRHGEAVACFRDLFATRTYLVITDYILDETFTLLKRRGISAKKTEEFYDLLCAAKQKGSLKVVFIDAKSFGQAWEHFLSYADQNLSFTDCTSFAVARTLKVDAVFSFDRHFEIAGFRMVP